MSGKIYKNKYQMDVSVWYSDFKLDTFHLKRVEQVEQAVVEGTAT